MVTATPVLPAGGVSTQVEVEGGDGAREMHWGPVCACVGLRGVHPCRHHFPTGCISRLGQRKRWWVGDTGVMDAVGAAKLGATQGSHESSRPLLFPLRREGGEEGRKEGTCTEASALRNQKSLQVFESFPLDAGDLLR